MPLDRQELGAVRILDGFDDPVPGDRRDGEARGDPADRLVVLGGDLRLPDAQDLAQAGAGQDLYPVLLGFPAAVGDPRALSRRVVSWASRMYSRFCSGVRSPAACFFKSAPAQKACLSPPLRRHTVPVSTSVRTSGSPRA